MKIILVGLTHPFRGGISHFTTSLYHSLSKTHDVKLISFSKLYPKILFPGKSQLDSTPSSFKALAQVKINSLNPFTWIKTIPLIKRERPDIILFMWWNPILAFSYFSIAKIFKLFTCGRVLFYCHNVFPHEENIVGRLFSRLALSVADQFLCQSTQDAKMVENLFPEKPGKKVFHPLYDIFPKNNISQAEAREELGVTSPVLLFFGHVRKYKGLETLLLSLPKILTEMKCTLVIAGEFYEPREKYDRIISELALEDRVIIKNEYIDNEKVEIYFAASDVVVLPYISASQSGIIPLAYHFNIPVIATNVGGLQDMLDDRKTGYQVPPNDPEKLASSVLEFFRKRDSINYTNNINAFKEKISWQSLVDEIENCSPPNPKK
ncbi:hypothetical protein UR09_03025 [Candidatus Nitromaritima sp. SCGC AAA799-A02]|nr:hypothetical protein UR09_03025 [Candidatus Nitromaritima sp. SCGC AAA799-A02]